jgi:hypothetical protein
MIECSLMNLKNAIRVRYQDTKQLCHAIDSRSRLFGDPNAHQDFSPFTQLGTLCNESKSSKVHVGARNDGNKLLAGANEIVPHNVGL